MMQPHSKKSDSSYAGHIKYHRQYPRYPVDQWPTLNNHLKKSDCYWWYCYIPVIKRSLTQCGAQDSLLVWQKASQTRRGKQYIGKKQKMKTHSGAQHILQIFCAYPKTPNTEIGELELKNFGKKSQGKN